MLVQVWVAVVFLVDRHYQSRNQFYQQFSSFWDRLYGQEYALYDCYEINAQEVKQIRLATGSAYAIYKKATHLVRNASDDVLKDLGFSSKAIPFLRQNQFPYETVIGRFDFVKTTNGLKVIEFNADTPTFIREVFEMNGKVAKEFKLTDPNLYEEEYLGKAIRNSIYHCATAIGVYHHPYVVFTAHEEDFEDRETMKYLMKSAKIKDARFVPLQDIGIVTEGNTKGAYDPEGKRIDVVYRHTYPLEALLEDVTTDQFPIGIEFLKLVEEKLVGMLNPISAFLMQSKAMMAVIWGMYEQHHPYFSSEEHEIIHQYFLPTYLDEEPFFERKEQYVSKPAFGREGDTVEIKQNGKALFTQKEKTYDHFVKVYQKFMELPTYFIKTEKGLKEAHLLIGSFIINEKPSGFGFRAGGKITDNLSYFLPCGVKGEIE